MLDRIRLTDFKSFADEQVTLAPLTLLVGANASGKSNCLDALRFLNGLVWDMTLGEVLNGEQGGAVDQWPGLRGGAAEACRTGTTSFAIETSWRIPPEGGQDEKWPQAITHRIACGIAPQPRLVAERLSIPTGGPFAPGGLLMETGAASAQRIEVHWLPENKGPVSQEQADRSLLRAMVWTGQGVDPNKEWWNRALFTWGGYAMQEALGGLRFLDVRPELMRGYGKRTSDPLDTQAKNISGVLAVLCEDRAERQGFVDWLAEICAPEIEDIAFIEVQELGDVMAVLVEKGGRRISIRSLSDGTLRFLGTLLALRTAPPESVILIEEIDIGLHPARIHVLMEFLEALVKERDIQIIATTHSPVVLQALRPALLRDVVVCGRVPGGEGTLLRRLGDLPHFEEVVRRKSIDELFTTGWMEMAL